MALFYKKAIAFFFKVKANKILQRKKEGKEKKRYGPHETVFYSNSQDWLRWD